MKRGRDVSLPRLSICQRRQDQGHQLGVGEQDLRVLLRLCDVGQESPTDRDSPRALYDVKPSASLGQAQAHHARRQKQENDAARAARPRPRPRRFPSLRSQDERGSSHQLLILEKRHTLRERVQQVSDTLKPAPRLLPSHASSFIGTRNATVRKGLHQSNVLEDKARVINGDETNQCSRGCCSGERENELKMATTPPTSCGASRSPTRTIAVRAPPTLRRQTFSRSRATTREPARW